MSIGKHIAELVAENYRELRDKSKQQKAQQVMIWTIVLEQHQPQHKYAKETLTKVKAMWLGLTHFVIALPPSGSGKLTFVAP